MEEKRYILKGESSEVDKVIRENRIRIGRGVISITPAEPERPEYDEAAIETLREVAFTSQKALQQSTAAHHELAKLTREVIDEAVKKGVVIPADLKSRLHIFGISVPEIEELAELSAEISENPTENVPKTENSEIMDDKNVETEDFKEVDLDADTKEVETTDTKEPPVADTKEVKKTAKKTTKKKTE